jgi:ABC-type transporter Mla subunit MlaD
MDRLTSAALSVWQVFLLLPVVTQAAVTIILVSAVIVHLFKYNEQTLHDGPSLFTTAGIFFTFLGIAEGLYGFDPQRIDASIPSLLDGLKTAFIASVVGVGAALTLKLRFLFFGLGHSEGPVDITGATIDDLHHRLVSLENSVVSEQRTLVGETIKSREESNRRLEMLAASQEAFLSKMADGNSKALISALQDVIRDFNVKISEQFGDNFKQLNVAVGRLLEWQEQYRLQLASMIDQQMRASSAMDTASKSYESLVDRSGAFTKSAESLSQLLTAIEEQRAHLSTSLEKLGLLFERASTGLPQIESKVIELTEQISAGVRQNNEEITRTIKTSGENIQAAIASARAAMIETNEAIGSQIVELTQQTTAKVQENNDEVLKTVRSGAEAMTGAVSVVRNMMIEANQSASTQINDHIRSLADKTTEQFSKLDVALETELSKSITSLGRQLTALSRQFVDDYTPLTDRLRALVQTARG